MLMEHTFEYIMPNKMDFYTISNIFTAHTYHDSRDYFTHRSNSSTGPNTTQRMELVLRHLSKLK